MMPMRRDPRLAAAIALFNAAEFFEAAELFEDLFFEAVREEVAVARALLQISTGCLHAERGQRRAAAERLEEGLVAIGAVTDPHGIDWPVLHAATSRLIAQIREGGRPFAWPAIAVQGSGAPSTG